MLKLAYISDKMCSKIVWKFSIHANFVKTINVLLKYEQNISRGNIC